MGILVGDRRTVALLVSVPLYGCIGGGAVVPSAIAQDATPADAPAGYRVVTGSFTVEPDGSVSGTLPLGYTKDSPPVDPDAPETAERIKAAPETGALRTATLPSVGASVAAGSEALTPRGVVGHAGCVTAESGWVRGGIEYRGRMVGCALGHLWLHTYLNKNKVRVDSVEPPNECRRSTSCEVPYETYTATPGCSVWVNYAHGQNLTTEGDSTAFVEWLPFKC